MFGERKPLLVAISGYCKERDRERSRLAGFDYHLVKPVNHAELLIYYSRIRLVPVAATINSLRTAARQCRGSRWCEKSGKE